jgi:hypothetical protein
MFAIFLIASTSVALGCGRPATVAPSPSRYVATWRLPQISNMWDADGNVVPAVCESTCAFARRPAETIVGCKFVRVDPSARSRLQLKEEIGDPDSMTLCELR